MVVDTSPFRDFSSYAYEDALCGSHQPVPFLSQLPERFSTTGSVYLAGNPRLRILAFGDSLTAGLHSNGEHFSPYASSLAQSFGNAISADILANGLSGLTAKQMVQHSDAPKVKDFAGRSGPGLRSLLRDHGPFSLALLMAGTNDLGKHGPEAICRHVQLLHSICHREGVPTVLLLVPPNKGTSNSPRTRLRWRLLNQLLSDWAQGPGLQEGVLLCVDTNALMPFDPDNGLWEDDGLHFSPAGSKELGRRLGALLAPLLAPEKLKALKVERPVPRPTSANSSRTPSASLVPKQPRTPAQPCRMSGSSLTCNLMVVPSSSVTPRSKTPPPAHHKLGQLSRQSLTVRRISPQRSHTASAASSFCAVKIPSLGHLNTTSKWSSASFVSTPMATEVKWNVPSVVRAH